MGRKAGWLKTTATAGDDNYDAWVQQYRPQKNHLKDNANHDGMMYETYGDEYAYVVQMTKTDPSRVWTLVSGDNGEQVLCAGWHYVNREGYFIAEVPFTDETICINLDEGLEKCPECDSIIDFNPDVCENCGWRRG